MKKAKIRLTNVSGWAPSFVKRLVQIFDSKYETHAEKDSNGIHIYFREKKRGKRKAKREKG